MSNCWLLFEKSEETRISKGIDKYQDKTGKIYSYDSFVPNHKNLSTNDFVILRKEDKIVGAGTIGNITKENSTKNHRRCINCQSTDIRERKTKIPKWKCGKCAFVFHSPNESLVDVNSYTATIEGFVKLDLPPTVNDVKRCAQSGDGIKSQLSMLRLDPNKIQQLLGKDLPTFYIVKEESNLLHEPTADQSELEFRTNAIRQLRDHRIPKGIQTPQQVNVNSVQYKRDPFVKAWVLNNANGICELCRCLGPFQTKDGSYFLEVHHVIPIMEGGPDVIENTVALCPNCHRRCHLSADYVHQKRRLYKQVERLKK